MLPTFTLLFAVGAGLRFGLAHLIRQRFDLTLELPQALALGLIVLSALPAWVSPLAVPLPLSLTLGVVLPDLLLRRA